MDFLKTLFPEDGGALTYEQLEAAAREKKLNIVNLADGGYVSKGKFDDTTSTLKGQITTLQGQLTDRDNDLNSLREQLTAAQADAGKLNTVQQSLTDLQAKYSTDKQNFEQRLSRQAYEFAVRERANNLHFSSASAKKAFVQEAIGKNFAMDGDNLLGYEDFVTRYKADDPGAFAADKPAEPTPPPENPAPRVVLPGKGTTPPPGKRIPLSELMRQKNENPDMQITFD